jgi:transient receptor potential cation channel subfamily V protein 6
MFKYAIRHPKKKADLTLKNNQSLTPLNLAAKLGRENLFREMLELRNVVSL